MDLRVKDTVVSATPMALWDLDVRGTILLSQGQSLTRFGIKPGQLVGQSVFEVNKNDTAARENIRRGLAGEAFGAEVSAWGLHWHNHYVRRYDAAAKVVGLIGISTDITDRKRADEALRAREERFHQMADLLPFR